MSRPGRTNRAVRLAAAGLLAAAWASPAAAQLGRRVEVYGGAGFALGPAWSLYDGWIRHDRRRVIVDPSVDRHEIVRTTYVERLEAPRALGGGVGVRTSEHFGVGLRGAFGRSRSTATYDFGGYAPDTFSRDVAWREVDLYARLILNPGRRVETSLYGGPSFGRWTIETGGTGRQALATWTLPLGETAPPVAWRDRELTTVGGFGGLGFRIGLADAWALSLGLEGRLTPMDYHALERAAKADIQAAVGRIPSLRYEAFTARSAAVSLGVRWTPVRRYGGGDPGEDVLAARRARPFVPPASPGRAEGEPVPGVDALLAAGDTAAALARVREAHRRAPDDAAIGGELGVLLALTTTAIESDFSGRVEAERLLHAGLRHDPGNARYLLALGVLLEKQGMRPDAGRVLTRALERAAAEPGALSEAELADVFFQRGRALEMRVLEFEGLRMVEAGRDATTCVDAAAASGLACLDNDDGLLERWARELPDLSGDVAERRAVMLQEFRRALEVVPGHAGAHRGIMAAAARLDDWDGVLAQARAYADASPADPWAQVFLGAALHWTGERATAEAAFARGLAGLRPVDRAVFEDLRAVLDRAGGAHWDSLPEAERERTRALYWAVRDPLFLTPANERRGEHYARVALAELLFGEPQTGRRGWETDRGAVLIRWGRPVRVWQIAPADGRLIFWHYEPARPAFVFTKTLGRSRVTHGFETNSQQNYEDMREARPSAMQPTYADAGPLRYQLARFRGAAPGSHELEIHARAPASLAPDPADTIVRGLYLLPRGSAERVVERTQRLPAADGAMSWRLVLPPVPYVFSLEAATPDLTRAAVARGEVAWDGAAEGFGISDLLLVERVAPRAGRAVSRRDLDYEPLRCTGLPEGSRLALVFELYGLETDADGVATYRVTLDAGRAPATSFVVGVLRGLRNLVRDEAGATLSFERTAEPAAGRTVEWFDVTLPDLGDASLTVTVEDPATGRAVSASRTLPAAGCR